jgi:hypothetical protein
LDIRWRGRLKTIKFGNLDKISITLQDGVYVLVVEEEKETYKLMMGRTAAINVYDELDGLLDYDLTLSRNKKNKQRRSSYSNGKS